MAGTQLDMTGQKLETFLTKRRARIEMQDEVRYEIFRNLSSATLEFDAIGYENPAELKDLMIKNLGSLGYKVEHVDEDTKEGKPIYHFHVRKERTQNA